MAEPTPSPADDLARLASNVVDWSARLASEVVALPDTLRTLRLAVDDLAHTLGMVRHAADRLLETMEPLSGAVDRVANIDKAVTDLHAVFFAVLDRVPGGKRALRGLPFTPPDTADADVDPPPSTPDTPAT